MPIRLSDIPEQMQGPIRLSDIPEQMQGPIRLSDVPEQPESRLGQAAKLVAKITGPGLLYEMGPGLLRRTQYGEQLYGQLSKGTLDMARAVAYAPSAAVKQQKLVPEFLMANAVLMSKDPRRQKLLRDSMADAGAKVNRFADWAAKPGKMMDEWIEKINQNHPEWVDNPPESFLNLVKSPAKLGLSLARSAPLLVSSGILTYAGRPDAAVALMYVTEGQEGYDQAKADGASDQDAATVYQIRGTVSAALENMQLQGFLKLGKGAFNTLLHRTTQKVAGQGLKSLTYEAIKIAAQETLEEMSQGAWGEITAKMVYDKSISDGVAGFIDRRAQEGYTAAIMGLLAGAGGAVGGVTARQPGAATLAVQPTVTPEIIQRPEQTIISKTGEFLTQETGGGREIPTIVKPGDRQGLSKIAADVETSIQRFPEVQSIDGIGSYFTKSKKPKDIDYIVKLSKPFGTGQELFDLSTELERLKAKYPDEAGGSKLNVFIEDSEGRKINSVDLWFVNNKGEKLSDIIAQREPETNIGRKTNRFSRETTSQQPPKPPKPPVTATAAPEPEGEQPKKLPLRRSQALNLGHDIPNTLGWTEAQRLDFNKSIIGKTSMKDMTLPEMRLVVEAMQAEAKKQGYELDVKEQGKYPTEELMGSLQKIKPTELKGRHPSFWRKAVYQTKKTIFQRLGSAERLMQNFFDELDNRDPDGPWKRLIFFPLTEKSSVARMNAKQGSKEVSKAVEQFFGKHWEKAWVPQKIDGVKEKYSSVEKITIALKSFNEHDRAVLLSSGITESELAIIVNSLTPEERGFANWAAQRTDDFSKPMFNAALQAGYDLSQLKKEIPYLPTEYVEPKDKPDFSDALADHATGAVVSPESRMFILRQPGAGGQINLDVVNLLKNLEVRGHRFIQMAPEAERLRSLLANTDLHKELNAKTYGQGSKILTEYIKGKIRGGLENKSLGFWSKVMAFTRRKGTAFASARNLLMGARQGLSFFTTLSNSPELFVYTAKRLLEMGTTWRGIRKLNQYVEARSIVMRDRNLGRDVRRLFSERETKRSVKKDLKPGLLPIYAGLDRYFADLSWAVKFDYAMDKLFKGDEAKSMRYADSEVMKTQSLPHAEDLPMMYRGGELDKLFTTFTRETSTLGNYWIHDIVGAKIHGEIGWTKASYRLLMSVFVPALTFGIISRGRLPKDPKELATDLLTYILGPTVIGAALINRIMTGLDSGVVAATAYDGLVGVMVQAFKMKDWDEKDDEEKARIIRQLLKKSAITVGGLAGFPSAQDIRSLEGAYDLWVQNTTDPRRLICSEYALTEDNEEDEEE